MSDPNDCAPDCGCSPRLMPRRSFLALSGLTILAAALPRPVMAGPFETADFAKLIPPDKRLHPAWVHFLFARGDREVYSKKRGELKYIGMPVGGLCCGTLYLGGDGKLWLWDIFNQNQEGVLPRQGEWTDFSGKKASVDARNGSSYVAPHEEQSPLEQGFALKVNGVTRRLDGRDWDEITFIGEYPLGEVVYTHPASPVTITLTAYSPFIPLDADDSGLPATVCEFALTNTSDKPVEAEIAGWLENACRLHSGPVTPGNRVNTVQKANGLTLVASRFDGISPPPQTRADIVVDDFERDTYAPWTTTGEAFGKGPVLRKDIPGYQGEVGGGGLRGVNSHASAPGKKSEEKDAKKGTLTSPPFTIERNYLAFYIGGGSDITQVGLRVLVDGKVVRQATGRQSNHMQPAALDVSAFIGKQGVIEVYDNATGGWGNIGVDDIRQTDQPPPSAAPALDRDQGTMALALLGQGVGLADAAPDAVFDAHPLGEAIKPVGEKLIGAITKSVSLAPGQSETVTFVIAWHFPNSGLSVSDAKTGNYYAKRFPDASTVAGYVARHYPRLSQATKLWHHTWHDSTLPHWFLNRTFVNTSILATTTAHRFGTGRFWGWEGVGCCEGTCTHVWHYAQAVGRLFPELERYTREHVDFGVAFDEKTGKIGFRGEGTGPAVDGQCGRILGVYREHQMSADDKFLRRIWPRVKEALTFLTHHDSDGNGLLDGAQDNTLDAAWYGEIAWISSLYAAALRACEEMATEVGELDFAALCRQKFTQTKTALETQLFNGEYFIQKPEKGHETSLGTYGTCHIDQVMGQSWAWQVTLGRILDRDKTMTALQSLYKYNFTPDIGPFRHHNTACRPYALAGDGGLIMTTNPKGLPHPFGNSKDWQVGYFNECMSGFEHQAASHMIAEGMLLEGLAVTRAIHDRYHPAQRNPYNEIECSDHYSRAMASYGSFLTACGFEYHGPKGHLGFDPRLTPNDFKAAFTAAEGWGTFAQKAHGETLKADLALKYGRLRLKTLALAGQYQKVAAKAGGKPLAVTVAIQNGRALVTFAPEIVLQAGEELAVVLS
ncbi:MAG: non-lysosomal glucosylceramidase [Armatimonadota bacterium]|nr:non-lysosomal glucosylceramidase [Armatimonadota bacterium]